MAKPKKITKFKSKKGATSAVNPKKGLGGGANSVKSAGISSTGHALPSQSQVIQSQQQVAVPPPAVPQAMPPQVPSQRVIPMSSPPVSQSQTMTSLKPVAYAPPLPAGGKTGTQAPIHPPLPPPPGAFKGSTLQGRVPGGMKSKTQSQKASEFSPEKQLEVKVEELTDQVTAVLEVADSLLDPEWIPEKIIDIIHVMVRSLNLDVVTMILPSMSYPEQLDNIHSRGYDLSPRKAVVNLWLKTFDEKNGIDWKKLMKLAEDTKSDLAYWIIHEGLDSIGYVPIRDGGMIYGFLFVAANGKKEQSPLTASLLDLCGTQLGLSYALKFTDAGK